MSTELLKKQIEKMDVKSEEFFDLYKTICDKYYSFDEEDDFLKAVMVLRQYIDKAGGNYEPQVITLLKIVEQLMACDKDGGAARMAHIGFDDKEYYFTVASDKKQITQMKLMMGKVLTGNFTMKKAKSPYGKNYF